MVFLKNCLWIIEIGLIANILILLLAISGSQIGLQFISIGFIILIEVFTRSNQSQADAAKKSSFDCDFLDCKSFDCDNYSCDNLDIACDGLDLACEVADCLDGL